MSRNTQAESDDDMNMDMDMPAGETGPLFWSMKLEPGSATEIDQPAIEGYIVHVTNACFSANVEKNSRTVVMVDPSAEDGDDDTASPVCVLTAGKQENQSLDLLFNESASFSLKGQKPSTVFLTGYIQPPVDAEGPMNDMDPMYEDMNEEQIMSALKAQRKQAEAADDEDQDEEEEDEEVEEPPAKKQKTASGAKAKKADKTKGQQKDDKKRKNAKGKKGQAAQEDAKEEEEPEAAENGGGEDKKSTKQNKKQDKKGKKKEKTLKNGLKIRDMKVGEGSVVAHGDKLRVFYVGQTKDKKVFDKCITGSGFEFNFGKGDVIKGWDMGLKGMKVGGKRKLTIPPKLAYGAAGSPPNVPGNATLTFTIELKGRN